MKVVKDIEHKEIPSDRPSKGQTIQDLFNELKKIKQKNINFYEKLYKKHKFIEIYEKLQYWKSVYFKIIEE